MPPPKEDKSELSQMRSELHEALRLMRMLLDKSNKTETQLQKFTAASEAPDEVQESPSVSPAELRSEVAQVLQAVNTAKAELSAEIGNIATANAERTTGESGLDTPSIEKDDQSGISARLDSITASLNEIALTQAEILLEIKSIWGLG